MSSDLDEPVENHEYCLFDEFLREKISINTVEYVVNKYCSENAEGKLKIIRVLRRRIDFGSLTLASKLIQKMLKMYPLKEILQAQAMFQWYKIQKQIKHTGITENECYKRAVIFHNTYPQVYPKLETNFWWYQWFLKNSIFAQDQKNLDLIDDPGEMCDFENPDEYINSKLKETELEYIENVNESYSIENMIMETFEINNDEDEFIIKPEIIYETDSLLDSNEAFTNYEIIEMDNSSNQELENLQTTTGNKINEFAKKVSKKNKNCKKIGEIKK